MSDKFFDSENLSDFGASKSKTDHVELAAIDGQHYFVQDEMKRKSHFDKRREYRVERPKSGYLFPTTLATGSKNHVQSSLFKMHYFEDSHSSLNKSFISKYFWLLSKLLKLSESISLTYSI